MSDRIILGPDGRKYITNEPLLHEDKQATELRRLHDLLGKANALCRIRADRIKKLEALNAELVEALRGWMNQPEDAATYDACMARAEAALAKVEANK